jgi:hypothetical protein
VSGKIGEKMANNSKIDQDSCEVSFTVTKPGLHWAGLNDPHGCLFAGKVPFMRKPFETSLHRRDVFRATIATVVASATSVAAPTPAVAATWPGIDKRKARYQAHSEEVENFYRVNRYPDR